MANLQEEIFESEDIKEAEDRKENDEEKEKKEIEASMDVDVIEEQIKPSKAFQIYAGQLYDPQSYDNENKDNNNNNITAPRIYDTAQSSHTNFESPLQTYKRLQFEIQQFQHKLDEIAQKAKKDKEDPTKQITQELSQQIGALWSNVEAFKNDPQISSLFSEANCALLDTVDANYLFKRLQEFEYAKSHINDEEDGDEDEEKQSSDDRKAVFTLYYDGLQNNKSYHSHEMDVRLCNLERIIGVRPDNVSIGDMTRSIEYLSSVLELLSDDSKLETLVRRAQVLRKKLQEIQAKGHAAIELQITKTKEEKINKLFEMMSRWDESALQLPTIVQRLRSIKNLHEESANIVQKVNRLETQNKLIQQSLESNKNILQNVQNSLSQNANTMQKNMKLIQQRLDKIQESMR